MKFVLLLILLASSSAFANCPIGLKIEKNQTTYSLENFNKFLQKLTLNRYVIRENDYKYFISVRLTKRSLYDEPTEKIAMVSVDVYGDKKNLITHTMASGKPSKLGLAAYNILQYEKALVDIVKELPKCI